VPVTPTAQSAPEYFRQDIQGLRGIAVLLVVIYHTGIALPGGYIGVDIFFVISGFVITQLLARETADGYSIRLAKFYSRRIKRILPAVAFAIVGTLFLSIFAMSPFGEQQEIAETARASSLFAANFYFFLQDSYWALAENPLRHLWSLAVEEQFYLVFPILIFALHKLKFKVNSTFSKSAFVLIAIVSFVVSYFLSTGNQFLPKPELFAFFGTPWRMWEFLAGSLIALVKVHDLSRFKSLVTTTSTAALVAIIWAGLEFDSFTAFPGTAALVPVLATAVLLYFGQSKNFLHQITTSRLLVFFGSISYSWYLWHWPLIVFANRLFPGSKSIAPVVAALLSIPIAIFSLRKLENPIRHNPKVQGRYVLLLAAICVTVPILTSVATHAIGSTGLGLKEIQSDEPGRASYADIRRCRIDIAVKENSVECIDQSFGPSAKTMMLVGDSAAGSFSDAIAKISNLKGFNFAIYYANSCPLSAKPFAYRENCAANFAAIAEKIKSINPDFLVIANMSDLYVSSAGLGTTIIDFDGRPAQDPTEALAFWISNWQELVKRDLSSRKTLIIQQPPLSAMREPVLLQKLLSSIQGAKSTGNIFDERISLDNSDTRNMIVEAEAKLFEDYKNIAVFNPADVLCDAKSCLQTLNGEALYYDGRHLTVKGSLLMVDGIMKALQPLLANN
jgi:peptidoglycan/LPS O-acetylase OafA/YrhL